MKTCYWYNVSSATQCCFHSFSILLLQGCMLSSNNVIYLIKISLTVYYSLSYIRAIYSKLQLMQTDTSNHRVRHINPDWNLKDCNSEVIDKSKMVGFSPACILLSSHCYGRFREINKTSNCCLFTATRVYTSGGVVVLICSFQRSHQKLSQEHQ